MITEIQMFGIDCDNCGESYDGGYSGFAYWADASTTIECASDNGWHQEGEKHYCPNCHSFNDEDELIIKPKP